MTRPRTCIQCCATKPVDDGIIMPAGFFCSIEHALHYSQKKQELLRKRETALEVRLLKSEKKNASRAGKEAKRTDIKWQHKLTQQAFNKMRVLEELVWFATRGEQPTCISCAKELGKDQWACGHYKTQGHNQSLRYDRKNTYLQHNYRCNLKMSGDIHGTATTRGFRQGILDRYGPVYGQTLIDHCERTASHYHWHWRELEDMRSEFNQTIKGLRALLKD